MKKKGTLLLTVLFSVSLVIKAQQDPLFTHYMYNTLWLNPAYAGTRDALTATAIYRSQWSGYDGAPVDQAFTVHSPILKGKAGLGLSLLNDKLGPSKSTLMAIDLSYQVKLSAKSKLSFGLKAIATFYSTSLSSLNLDQQDDAAFSRNINNIVPNVGTGVYYYRRRFYAGISTPRLLANRLNAGATGQSKEQQHFYFIAGTVIYLGRTLKLKPTTFIKSTKGAPAQADVTATFIFNDRLNLGLMYRTGNTLGILAGYSFTAQCYLGYSFDWSMASTTSRYGFGSHEVMLRYDLIYKSEARIKSPRFF